MIFLNQCGFGLQFLLLTALTIASLHAEIQLSDEYLKDIREDEAFERAAGEYNYDYQGDDWMGTCQTGQRQSPIDLVTDLANKTDIPRIRFQNYDQSLRTPLLLVNNGHTANMVLSATRSGRRASISGGMLPGVFEAQSVHFHWGSPVNNGSEHAIDFYRFDVEIHIVHKNSRYETMDEATQNWDGLAVLGIMLRAVSRTPSSSTGLNKVFNLLPRITRYQSNATLTGRLTVGQLLGSIEERVLGQFFTYNGSLTTPDCAESVTWTVFKDVVNFPRQQINKLFNLQESRGRPLINNYRELQDINERPVYLRELRGQ